MNPRVYVVSEAASEMEAFPELSSWFAIDRELGVCSIAASFLCFVGPLVGLNMCQRNRQRSPYPSFTGQYVESGPSGTTRSDTISIPI